MEQGLNTPSYSSRPLTHLKLLSKYVYMLKAPCPGQQGHTARAHDRAVWGDTMTDNARIKGTKCSCKALGSSLALVTVASVQGGLSCSITLTQRQSADTVVSLPVSPGPQILIARVCRTKLVPSTVSFMFRNITSLSKKNSHHHVIQTGQVPHPKIQI